MKKNWRNRDFYYRKLPRMLIIMKMWSVLLLIGTMQLNASNLYSQQKKMDISMKDASLIEVFRYIRQNSDYTFVYDSDAVKRVNTISLDLKNVAIEEILNHCLQGSSFIYLIEGNLIIIKEHKNGQQQVKRTRVKGFVYDTRKQPLPGVTVKLVGTSAGTATDARGWFQATLPVDSGRLEFSFIGFKNKQIFFSTETAKDTLRIILEEDLQVIDEVVVTGYQKLREKSMAGSYSKVKADDLVMTGTETLETMLQGKLPGVMVMHTSGLTGTRQKVRVRGTSTILGNAEPVWVVDGIIQEDNLPFEASELANINDNVDMMRDFIGGAISWLNPNDIEDITVLKDASATAIYGVKAANGVILITTKKGERGRMAVNYAGGFTVGQRMNYNRQEVMNSKERVALSREAFDRGARTYDETVGYIGLALAYSRREISLAEFEEQARRLETMNTDWFDILYRTPFSQSHSVSFSGGNDDATYRVSFGYNNVKNTAKGNDKITYTGNLNTSMTFWDKLSVTASLSGSREETGAFASGVDPFNYAINTSRAIACHEDDGGLSYYKKGGYNYNILNELSNSGNENTKNSLTLNLNARWNLTQDIALQATLGGGTSNSFGEMWYTERSHYITSIRQYEYGAYSVSDEEFKKSKLPYGGMLAVTESRNFNYTARLQAEYTRLFNAVHSVNLMAGFEVRSNQYDGMAQTNWGYMPDRGKSFTDVPIQTTSGVLNADYARTSPTITETKSNYVSYYATAGYMFDNRYSINLSVRGDGSNAFGEQGKFLPIWSAGLRWNVIDESWMREQKLVNNLAFTASLGYQGSVVEGIGPDLVASLLPVDAGTGEYKMEVTQLPNADLKWEKTLSVNLGTHFSFFNSKINGTFEWYYKKTTDVITNARVPYENGVASMYVNDGDVTNKGWDLALSVVPIRTKDFMWSLSTTFSGNSNNVDSELQSTNRWKDAAAGTINKKGYPVGAFWAFKYAGLDPTNGKPLFNLSDRQMGLLSDKFINGNFTAEGVEDVTDYMVYMGTREPTFTMGLNMTFRWKRFTMPLSIYVSRGNKEFLSSPYETGYMMMSEYVNASDELKKRWQKPGDEKYTNIPSIPVDGNCREYPMVLQNGTVLSDFYPLDAWAKSDIRVVDAWYVRLGNIQLTYNMPEQWIRGFADNVTLSFIMTNPLQIRSKDFKGRDPEVALGSQPRTSDFSFNVKISF